MTSISKVVLTLMAGILPTQAATILAYPDFSSTAGSSLLGGAVVTSTGDGSVLRIAAQNTGSGAIFSSNRVSLGPSGAFSTTFDFRFTNAGGTNPADGIVFVLAADNTHVGGAGGLLGYTNIFNSFGVEFDTFDNGAADTSNEIAIDYSGRTWDANPVNVYGISSCIMSNHLRSGCMSNGDIWRITIGYDGANLSVSAWDYSGAYAMATPFIAYSSLPWDIFSKVGTLNPYVGITGATGLGYETQDILNWRFADDLSLTLGAPEPGTIGMMLAGFVGIGIGLVRRKAIGADVR